MEDAILIHGDYWKVSDVKEEVEWCRKQLWEQESFVPRDAIKQKYLWAEHKEGRAVPEGGWEHEHCQVCWWKIRISDDPEIGIGYTNGNQWLCAECYRQFVAGNALGINS
jgi:hypothetical protein